MQEINRWGNSGIEQKQKKNRKEIDFSKGTLEKVFIFENLIVSYDEEKRKRGMFYERNIYTYWNYKSQ